MKGVMLAAVLAVATSAAADVPWVHDNYKDAVAKAAKEHKPIFVEAWAPW